MIRIVMAGEPIGKGSPVPNSRANLLKRKSDGRGQHHGVERPFEAPVVVGHAKKARAPCAGTAGDRLVYLEAS